MPPRNRNKSAAQPPNQLSALRVPLEAAESYLRERMGEGSQLVDVEPTTTEELKDLERRAERWRDKLRTWLDLNLGGTTAEEFRFATTRYSVIGGRLTDAQELHYLREALREDLSKVESIVDRLDLWAPADAGVTSGQAPPPSATATVFIVHGSDTPRAEQVARTVEKITRRDAVILHLEPNGGKTLIEKLEANAAEAAFAVAILTGDDVGGRAGSTDLKPRARQNVVFEMGFFFGHIGRARTCVLYDDSVELPSDVDGLVYVKLDSAEAWKAKLRLELVTAGLAQ